MPVALPRPAVQGLQGQQQGQQHQQGRIRAGCPSPSFDARSLRSAKWSSSEELSRTLPSDEISLRDGPRVWTPRGAPSPAAGDKDFRPVKFDGDSLQRGRKGRPQDRQQNRTPDPSPKESFAWQDRTLDKEIKAIRKKNQSQVVEGEESFRRGRPAEKSVADRRLDRSLSGWGRSSSLPKAPDQEVILLKKAREEKKVKKYLDERFTNRPELVQPDQNIKRQEEREGKVEDLIAPPPPTGKRSPYKEIGGATVKVQLARALFEKQGGYTSDSDAARFKKYEDVSGSSPPRSPPPFSKKESRFEREQKIRVGSVDAYKPGYVSGSDPERDKIDAPPAVSAAQEKYEHERFRVQPGSIQNYGLGKGALAEQERKKLFLLRLDLNERLTSSNLEGNMGKGCAITKYSSNHSYNPLTSSKSAQNLIMSEGAFPITPSIKKFHMQSALKDGYESDSSLIIRRTETPIGSQTPVEAKLDYNRIQRGGDIPHYGLRMTLPDKPKDDEMEAEKDVAATVEEAAMAEPKEVTEQAEEKVSGIDADEKTKPDDDDDVIKVDDEVPPPSPPRRGSQTGQKLKRLSKMIKNYSTSKNNDENSERKSNSSSSPQRKSLKERLTDGELVVFLRERRAVSENRFRILDKLAGSTGSLVRTKSDPKMNEVGNKKSKKKKSASSDSEKDAKPKGNKDDNSTSPEEKSDVDKRRSKSKGGRSRSKDKRAKNSAKKKHSTCSACNSNSNNSNSNNSQDENMSKKEKKRQQKRDKAKKADDAVVANGNVANHEEKLPDIPPYPKDMEKENWTRGQRNQFFQKLLIKEDVKNDCKTNKIEDEKVGNATERKPRSALKKRPQHSYVLHSKTKTTPVLNAYLYERRIVSDSIFKRVNTFYDRDGQTRTLPIMGEKFDKNRSVFANGTAEMATFPRSVSNLEKRSGYGEMHKRKQSKSPDLRSQDHDAEDKPRSTSLPRPGSGLSDKSSVGHQSQLDHEEYKNYVLEMLHKGPKSARFQQLQSYYNNLDKALKLEKKSSSSEVHKLKSDEVVDFETWRKLRVREKASEELEGLLKDLRAAQKAREFFFRPKEIESVRWRGDAHLRGRDKSVDNLKSHFNKIVQDQKTEECRAKVEELNQAKDVYKPLWRARSVSDLAKDKKNDKTNKNSAKGKSSLLHQEGQQQRERSVSRFQTFPQVRPVSISRSRSSLTAGQVSQLKDQLNDIYVSVGSSLGGGSSVASARSSRSPSRNQGLDFGSTLKLGDMRKQLEMQNLFGKPVPEIIRQSHVKNNHQGEIKRAASPFKTDEDMKKRMSQKIGRELKRRSNSSCSERGASPVMRRYVSPGRRDFDMKEEKQPNKFKSGRTVRETSPRTCYSLEQQLQEQEQKEANNTDFLIVLNQDKEKEVEVRSVVDNWASGDEGKGKTRKKNKSSESLSSSGTSTGTVIHRKNLGKKLNTVRENESTLSKRRSVEELTRSYESLERERRNSKSLSPSRNFDDVKHVQIREIKKSFENLAAPKAPTRCASLGRADQTQGKVMLRRSRTDVKTRRFTVNEDAPTRKITFDSSTRGNVRRATNFEERRSPSPYKSDPTKYARSYLALVKTGEVLAKKGYLEDHQVSAAGRPPSPYKMPDVDLDYIREHLTDLSKTVMKPKEIGDVSGTRSKIEEKEEWKNLVSPSLIQSGKTKLMKHISRKVGHAKILSRMMSLQGSPDAVDAGAVDLFERALEEKEHFKTFRGGKVESVVDKLEGRKTPEQVNEEQSKAGYSELDQKYPFEPNPNFSWSGRFAMNLPQPRQSYTSAQKHGHFKSYYGYLPSEVAKNMNKGGDAIEKIKKRLSLEDEVTLPPPPPARTAEPIYSKIMPRSEREKSISNDGAEKERGKYNEGEINIHYKSPVRHEELEGLPEEELRQRQEAQMRDFYDKIEERKEQQLRKDIENRKHHDTLLPNQKSPVPLNRYEEVDGQQEVVVTPNSTLNRPSYKMVVRALYNFQAQNGRELGFKKGDIVYVKRQIDGNWYEGERNAMIGIFPTSYVEVIPENEVNTLKSNVSSLSRGRLGSPFSSSSTTNREGQAKARFNFQAQTPMELSLVKGEQVTLIRRIDRNWYEGRIGHRKGIFPASYIDVQAEPTGPENRGMSPKPAATPVAHGLVKNGNVTAPPAHPYIPPDLNIGNQGRSQFMQSQIERLTGGNASSANDHRNEPVPYRALYNYQPQNEDEVELQEGDVVYVMEKCDDGWFVGTSQRSGIFGTFPGNYVTRA